MSFEAQRDKIKEICGDLLKKGEVETIIGYTAGDDLGRRIPYIFSEAAGAETLEWDHRCAPNLCKYLIGRKDKKVGIAAKPCDARGIVNYLVEKQLIRENIFIIGLDCGGMVDAAGEKLAGCCGCNIKKPPLYDVRIENSDSEEEGGFAAYADSGLAGDREHFDREIKKCILCFSCRQSCYACYCKVCFMDRGLPNWQPSEPGAAAKMVYHLGRAMHLAGRCIECGACEKACASGADVRYLIKEITGFIEETYGFRTGFDPDEGPFMASYKADDSEAGFLGGDEHE